MLWSFPRSEVYEHVFDRTFRENILELQEQDIFDNSHLETL